MSPTTTPEVCSLFSVKQALEALRAHALHVRDIAQSSAVQLAGPGVARDFSRKTELPPDQGINGHLLSLVQDIEAVLSDCDDFAESILVLTGKWHQEETEGAKASPTPSETAALAATTLAAATVASAAASLIPDSRQEPTSDDEPNIAIQTGLADLVATVAGVRAGDRT